MSNKYNAQRYGRKKRWIPYDQWLARKLSGAKISGQGPYRARRSYPKTVKRPPRSNKSRMNYPGVGSALGSLAGGLLGGGPGAAIGGALGNGAQSLIKTLTGFGDYSVKSNSLLNIGPQVPMFSASKDGSIVVMYREYIMDIVTSPTVGLFQIQNLAINPGIDDCFPWLSTLALAYEEWQVFGMLFEFKTTSGSVTTSQALGEICMSTEYNPYNAPFSSKQQMLQSIFSVSSVPSCDVIHPIECDIHQTREVFNIRDGSATPANADIRMYDIGRFSVATVGSPSASATLGELYVTYHIKLNKPRFNIVGASQGTYVHFTASAGITTAAYFGTNTITSPNSDFAVTLTGTVVTIPFNYTGNFSMSYDVTGTATACVNPVLTVAGTATLLLILDNDGFNVTDPTYGSTSNIISTSYWSCVGGCTITFSGATLPTAATWMDLIIMPMTDNAD